MGKLEIWQN